MEHVSKSYRNVKANDDVSFWVGDGEIAVLAGPNEPEKVRLLSVSQVCCGIKVLS